MNYKKYLIKMLSYITTTIIFLILIAIIVVNISPYPIALFVRNSFNNPKYSTNDNVNIARQKIDIIRNLTYESKFENNKFDIYSPKLNYNQKNNFPSIIWTHGGAFVGGDKQDITDYAILLASEGYNVIAINYQLAPERKYPTPVLQLSEAVSHISKKYHFDMSNVFFAGDSAGAQITSQFLLVQTNPDYAKNVNIQPIINASNIRGTLLFCGPYDMNQFAQTSFSTNAFIFNQIGWSYFGNKNWLDTVDVENASVINHINSQFPIAYVTDGNTGSFEHQGKELVQKLEEQGINVQSRFFDINKYQTVHEFQFYLNTIPSEIVLNDTLFFLKRNKKY